MNFFSSFVLICVLLFGTCEGQRFFSSSDGYLDADGRPNLMKFIWQRGNLNGFELTNYDREKLLELRTSVQTNWMNYQKVIRVRGPDGEWVEGTTQLPPDQVFNNLKREMEAALGPEFVSRLTQFTYRRFIEENTLLEFMELPEISIQLDISVEQVKSIRDKEIGRLRNKNRETLSTAFRELVSKFDEKRRELLLKKLEVKDDGQKKLSDWVLNALPIGAKPQYRYLLTGERLSPEAREFDYSLFFQSQKAVAYLELVEEQEAEINRLLDDWQDKSTAIMEKNRVVSQILLPDQMEFLNDFAWREIYLSGSFMEFMNHSFIQKEFEFTDSQLSKLLPQLDNICTDATDRVKKNRDEFNASIQQILGQDARSRLKLLVGP